MNEHETKTDKETESPLQRGLMFVSAAWIAGLGAIGYLTAPSPTAAPAYLPATVETEEIQEARASAIETENNSVDFIVRFKDVEEVDACLDMFKENPASARDLFASWASEYDTLGGMTLKKTSYAGEMILSWSTEDGHRPNRADIIAKQGELQSMPVVKYADPDYTAHAGDTTQ